MGRLANNVKNRRQPTHPTPLPGGIQCEGTSQQPEWPQPGRAVLASCPLRSGPTMPQ